MTTHTVCNESNHCQRSTSVRTAHSGTSPRSGSRGQRFRSPRELSTNGQQCYEAAATCLHDGFKRRLIIREDLWSGLIVERGIFPALQDNGPDFGEYHELSSLRVLQELLNSLVGGRLKIFTELVQRNLMHISLLLVRLFCLLRIHLTSW